MSDYNETQRRIIGGKKIQYAAGGSRKHKSFRNTDKVSRVGHVNPSDVYAASNQAFLPIQSNKVLGELIASGKKTLPEGTKFISEFDEKGRWMGPDGKWYTQDSYVVPGDIIEIVNYPEEPWLEGYRAMVKRVRSETRGTVSGIIQDGPNANIKYVFEKEHYKVVRRTALKPIPDNDYLTYDVNRKDIVKEDE